MRQSWEDALHARFDCFTGDPVTTDEEWGHLQVIHDVVSQIHV